MIIRIEKSFLKQEFLKQNFGKGKNLKVYIKIK